MSNLDQVWGSVSADSDNEENVTPPPGTYIVRIAGTRAGTSKKGEQYFAIDLKDDAQGHKWMIYKAFTKNGQPHEGSIKSAKITLRQLGLDVQSPSQLEAALGSITGRLYAVEVKASDKVNQVTGQFYLNTDITGPASPPTLNVAPAQPAPQVQAPPQQYATQVGPGGVSQQVPVGMPGQPAAVVAQPTPGQTLDQAMAAAEAAQAQAQQAPAPGSQFGDQAPWDRV